MGTQTTEEVKQKLHLLPDKSKQFLFTELAKRPEDIIWAPFPLLRPASLAAEGAGSLSHLPSVTWCYCRNPELLTAKEADLDMKREPILDCNAEQGDE